MSQKTYAIILLLLSIGSTCTSLAYAYVYQTNSMNCTQTVIKTWYDSNWHYRKQITINSTRVSANLTDFPVLIAESSDTNLAAHAQTSGGDIMFVSPSEGKLCHEIEKYNSTNGQLIAWVKLPQISNKVNTTFYMYYGNPAASNQQNTALVWSSYVAVYHFKDGSGLKITDSTLNNNATLYGGGSHWVSSLMGNAYNFDGSNDYAIIAANPTFDSSTYTIEAWVKPNRPAAWTNIMAQNCTDALGPCEFQFGSGAAATTLATDYGGPTWHPLQKTSALTYNIWNSYVSQINMATSNQSLWKNGALVASQIQTDQPNNYSNGTAIGIGSDSYGNWKFKGAIDELRFSNTARSKDWLLTEYNNQYSPSTFMLIGAEIYK
jgi:hypothetical protein